MSAVSHFSFGFKVTPEAFAELMEHSQEERREILESLATRPVTGNYSAVAALIEHDAVTQVVGQIMATWDRVQELNAGRERQYTFVEVVQSETRPGYPQSPFSRSTAVVSNLIEDVVAHVKVVLHDKVTDDRF